MMIVRDPAVARRFDLHHRVAQCGKVSSRVTTDQRVRTFRFQLSVHTRRAAPVAAAGLPPVGRVATRHSFTAPGYRPKCIGTAYSVLYCMCFRWVV